jgi:paxillin
LEKKWHPEHFVCAFCMNALAGGSFTEHNSKAYCRECSGKLFPNS